MRRTRALVMTLGLGLTIGLPAAAWPAAQAQAGGAYVFIVVPPVDTVSPTSWSAPADGGTQVATVTASAADAAWVADSSQGWLTASPASGTGNGRVTLTATANPSSTAVRSATVTIGSRTIAVTQAAAAVLIELSPRSWSVPAAGGTRLVTVTSSDGNAAWSATSNQTWLSLSRTSGTGSGSVTLTATANPSSVRSRAARVTIGGQTVVVSQAPNVTTIAVSPANWTVSGRGGTQVVTVRAAAWDTPWTATSSEGWLTLVRAGGTGSGNVTLVAAPNPSSLAGRTATVTIGGQSVVVTQAAATVRVTPSTWSAPARGGSRVVTVFASATTTWTVTSEHSWVTVGRSSGTGSGTVLLTATANPSRVAGRTATVTIGGQAVTVTQPPGSVPVP